MIVTIQALIYGGKPLDIIHANLKNAGHGFNIHYLNIYGLATAYNAGLKFCIDGKFDAVVFISNDIQEPDGWLRKRIDLMESDHLIGVCSVPINEIRSGPSNEDLIGNLMISRKVIDTIGAFNYEFDPYGPLDLDYCLRARLAGFKTSYVIGSTAVHPHPHGGNDAQKAEQVNRTWNMHVKDVQDYQSGGKSLIIPLRS